MKRILCFGDSNTFGTGPMRSLDDDPIHPKNARWAGVMAAELGDGFDVIIEGLPGRTTVHDDPIEGIYRNGLRTMHAIIESHRPIDLMIILLGTNDGKQRFGLTPQDIALGVKRLIVEASATGHVDKILAIAPPPTQEHGALAQIFTGAAARSQGLSDQIEYFARAENAAFIDAGMLISVDPIDGVHWSAKSHEILGRAIAKKVQGIFA